MRHFWIILTASIAIAATGCAAKHARPDAGAAGSGVPANSGTNSDASGTTASAAAPAEVVKVTPNVPEGFAAGPTGELLSRRIVYFDFDRDELKPDDAAIVAAHAKYLVANPGVKVRLEGHTDERGTREYNIGLGERRAQAVRQALRLQGVADSQTTTVSFGEERPAVAGEGESVWAQNRRVEILYLPQ